MLQLSITIVGRLGGFKVITFWSNKLCFISTYGKPAWLNSSSLVSVKMMSSSTGKLLLRTN